MTGLTHLAAGAALGAACMPHDPVIGGITGGICGLLPDIDHPGSMLGRYVSFLAVALESRPGHRDSVMHTVWPVPIVAALCSVIGLVLHMPLVILPGLAGYLSHLALDCVTRSGLHPFRLPLRIRPGSPWRDRLAGTMSEWNQGIGGLHLRGPVQTGQGDWREMEVMLMAGILLLTVLAL